MVRTEEADAVRGEAVRQRCMRLQLAGRCFEEAAGGAVRCGNAVWCGAVVSGEG